MADLLTRFPAGFNLSRVKTKIVKYYNDLLAAEVEADAARRWRPNTQRVQNKSGGGERGGGKWRQWGAALLAPVVVKLWR